MGYGSRPENVFKVLEALEQLLAEQKRKVERRVRRRGPRRKADAGAVQLNRKRLSVGVTWSLSCLLRSVSLPGRARSAAAPPGRSARRPTPGRRSNRAGRGSTRSPGAACAWRRTATRRRPVRGRCGAPDDPRAAAGDDLERVEARVAADLGVHRGDDLHEPQLAPDVGELRGERRGIDHAFVVPAFADRGQSGHAGDPRQRAAFVVAEIGVRQADRRWHRPAGRRRVSPSTASTAATGRRYSSSTSSDAGRSILICPTLRPRDET